MKEKRVFQNPTKQLKDSSKGAIAMGKRPWDRKTMAGSEFRLEIE